MISRILLFSVLFFNGQVFSQILHQYPEGQEFYLDGMPGLSADFSKAVKSHNFQPCENKNESYTVSVLVNPDRRINIVKDVDTVNINKNKCAYDFVRKVLPNLKNWKPAIVEEQAVKAIASFTVKPSDFFAVENPNSQNSTPPEFPGGLGNFRRIIGDIFIKSIEKNKASRTEIHFFVGTTGEMEDIIIYGNYSEKEKQNLIYQLKKIKEKWKPGVINGVSVRSKMTIPIVQEFSFDWERQKMEEQEKYPYQRRGL